MLVTKIIADTFLDNVKTYLEHVQSIQLGIQLAKLGIVNPKLIDVETISHLDTEQFELIRTSVWIKDNIVYFVLTIPKTFSKYHRFRILPIPDGDNRELVLSLDVDYIRKNEKLFKLENHKIKPLNDPCLENLLNDKLSNCTFKTNKETSVTFVQPNMVLTKNLDQITVYQNCNDLNVSIYGNNLLTFSNCRLKIGYFEIESKINIAQTSIVPFVKTLFSVVSFVVKR